LTKDGQHIVQPALALPNDKRAVSLAELCAAMDGKIAEDSFNQGTRLSLRPSRIAQGKLSDILTFRAAAILVARGGDIMPEKYCMATLPSTCLTIL